MKKLLSLVIVTFLFTATAQAAQVAHVKVNGLVCDFCARALEKTFSKKDEVEKIDVDLNEKLVTVFFKGDATLDDSALTKIITYLGYNVEGIHRMDSKDLEEEAKDE